MMVILIFLVIILTIRSLSSESTNIEPKSIAYMITFMKGNKIKPISIIIQSRVKLTKIRHIPVEDLIYSTFNVERRNYEFGGSHLHVHQNWNRDQEQEKSKKCELSLL